MISAKKALSTAAIALCMAAGALAVTAGTASARVVCNSEGDCWHTDQNVRYPRGLACRSIPTTGIFTSIGMIPTITATIMTGAAIIRAVSG